MKKKIFVFVAVLVMMIAFFCWAGIGFYSSGSAVRDLKIELEAIYGTEYKERDTETGTEDMAIFVEPKTWFLTDWNLRNALSMDYKYECKVVFTTRVDGSIRNIRTITYQAVDPMGSENGDIRAHLLLESKAETTEKK